MGRSLTVRGAQLVLPDRVVVGDLVAEDGIITEIAPRATRVVGDVVEGAGLVVLPGLVDTHVRLDALEDMGRLGPALLAGGITSVVGVRQASNAAQLAQELAALAEHSLVNYALYVRADDGAEAAVAASRAAGIWVQGKVALAEPVFALATGLVVVDHQDPELLAQRWGLWAGAPDVADLPRIHDIDTCVAGLRRTLELATRHGTRTHILQVSTAEELALFISNPRITASVGPAHLFADDRAYERLGTRAVCSPPVRGPRHPAALWEGLHNHAMWVCSAHFPVDPVQKDVPLPATHPGWPSAEWLLPLLLDAAFHGRCSLRDVARWSARAPAEGVGLRRKGRLETGYDADLVIVDPQSVRTVGSPEAPIHTFAGWSPWIGRELHGWPVRTILGGETAWLDHESPTGIPGRELKR